MPSELGYRYPDGRHFSIQSDSREIHADWLSSTLVADQLLPQSRESQELRRLVQDWKQQVTQ
jgi:hypothetical protein